MGQILKAVRVTELVITIKRADAEDLSRVEELTLRTSQMNATGVHYPDKALRGLLDDPGHEVLTVSLSDRFGPTTMQLITPDLLK